MSARLERLIEGARERDGAWDHVRASRIRERALRTRAAHVRRDRALRRGLLVAGGAGLLVLALLRAASSAPAEAFTSTASAPGRETLASRALGDAGNVAD